MSDLTKKIKNRTEELIAGVGDMSLKRRAENIIENLELKDGDKVIDLGCGDGFFLHLLDSLPVKLNIIGLDPDSWTLTRAKENLGKRKIKLVRASVTRIPFKSNSFDKVILTEVLEHVDKDQPALKEIYRILKPGGIMVLTVPNWNFPFLWDPFNWVLQRFFNTHITKDFWSGIWLGHLRLYKRDNLVQIIQKAGFKLEIVKELTFWCLPFNHYLVNIVARLLYGHKLPSSCSRAINKFESTKKSLVISLMFFLVNLFDKLNDILPLNPGLNIFVKGVKDKS